MKAKYRYILNRLNLSAQHRRCAYCRNKASFWLRDMEKPKIPPTQICFGCAEKVRKERIF